VPVPATESQPTRSRRNLVLTLAGVTSVTEAASVGHLLPDLPVGALDLSIALLPALVLAIACGSRLLGRSAIRRAAAGFWIASAVLLVGLAGAYLREGRFVDFYPALVAAALGEELIYRLAIPAAIAAALRVGGVRPNAARIAGLAGAALWFVLLPGHREQVTNPAGIIPFVAFAALSAFIVYRSGSVLPMAIGHAVSNLLTVLMWREAVPADARSVGLACVLGLLVLAYGQTRTITHGDDGRLLDVRTGLAVVAIDLRDGHQATVQLTDGRTLPVDGDFALPRHTPVVLGADGAPTPS
jgi:hypothetical protein